MATYRLWLHLGFDQLPSRDDLAFLGSMDARAQPWGSTDLQVALEVTAPDIAAALTRAKELVADRLGGEIQEVRVTRKGFRMQPTGFWRRWRRRAS